jgi:FkbM family methyltransferase
LQQVRGIWFPDEDAQLGPQVAVGPTIAGKGTFQLRKLWGAINYIGDLRHAVDVGGHVGSWSWPLSRMFANVTSFEPLEIHRECYRLNVPGDEYCKVTLHDCGLGEKRADMKMNVKKISSSTSYISANGDEPVRIETLDSFDLTDVDFIKIDTEGFEAAVVKGGEQTIRRWKPVMIVEQKPNNAERQGYRQREAVEMLQAWGATEVRNLGNDITMVWK